MYKLFRFILFQFDAERVHYFVVGLLRLIHQIFPFRALFRAIYIKKDPKLAVQLFGLDFENPVGLAAGFDKNAAYIDPLSDCGFGFIEIGTITPKAQPGNDKPRLFRLKADQAILNRMGFNNDGVEQAITQLKARKNKHIIIGGNIGKNKWTPNEEATQDYVLCFEALFPYVDYFVVNVSSPNTPNLRALQEKGPLLELLSTLQRLNTAKPKQKPILLKIAPDLSNDQLLSIIDVVNQTFIDGIIATNTTVERKSLKSSETLIKEQGGLSGAPLTNRSTEVIRFLHKSSNGKIPIIGVGGIMSPNDAIEKIKAGASLIQLYSGFVYSGPSLVRQINKTILDFRLNQ